MKSESTFVQIFELGLKLIVNHKNRVALDELNQLLSVDCSSFESLKLDLRKSNTEYKIICDSWDKLDVDGDVRFDFSLNILSTFFGTID